MWGLLTRNQVGLIMLSLLSQESSWDLVVLLNRRCGSELKYATYCKSSSEIQNVLERALVLKPRSYKQLQLWR